MLETLTQRTELLAKASQKDEIWKEAEKMLLINGEGQMPYMRWDPQTRMLKPTKDATMSVQECLRAVQNLTRLAQDPTTTLRFHALTKVKDQQDRSIPWLWLMSSRNQPEAWAEARHSCYHAIWQLIRCQIRPQSAERSPLAKQIQKQLNGAQ